MAKFRIFCRASGVWYIQDRETGEQHSLRTRKESEATRLLNAQNEAFVQPMLNRQIARAYLSATDPVILRVKTSHRVAGQNHPPRGGFSSYQIVHCLQEV